MRAAHGRRKWAGPFSLAGLKNSTHFESFLFFSFSSKSFIPWKIENDLKKIEQRIFLWVKFTKLRLFFRCVFKDVIFIIKFEPMGEINFENGYVFN